MTTTKKVKSTKSDVLPTEWKTIIEWYLKDGKKTESDLDHVEALYIPRIGEMVQDEGKVFRCINVVFDYDALKIRVVIKEE